MLCPGRNVSSGELNDLATASDKLSEESSNQMTKSTIMWIRCPDTYLVGTQQTQFRKCPLQSVSRIYLSMTKLE